MFAAGGAERAPDTPGWSARVVPNLYPAFDRQEVVVHTPRHVRSITELRDDELEPVGVAWDNRIEAARADGYPYVHVLLNEGRDAGASLPHSHSQLIWLREAPPEATREYPQLQEHDCALCRILAEDALTIVERDGLRLLAHPAGRSPYELLVAPLDHRPKGDAQLYAVALGLLRDGVARVRAAEGAVPTNAWGHPGGHWHLELVPRISVLAGLELGAGLYVNWLPPEEAAERLRAVA